MNLMKRLLSVKSAAFIGIFTFVSLIVVQVAVILAPEDDANAVATLRARGAEFERHSRAPILYFLDIRAFEYGHVWYIRYAGVIDAEIVDVFVSAKELTRLYLADGTIPNRAVLRNFAALSKLESLSLVNIEIDDEDLAQIAGIPNLRQLAIGRCTVSDAGLLYLTSARNLKLLAVFKTRVDQQGVDAFKRIRTDVVVSYEFAPAK